MTDSIITYIIIVIIAALVILSSIIWLEKMIKIILWNYILSSICLALSQSINLFIKYLENNPDWKIFWISNDWFSTFLNNWKTTIIMIIYWILLFIIYQKSKISIKIPEDEIIQKSLYLFFIPLTVISFIITLQIAIMWTNILNPSATIFLWNALDQNEYFQIFIKNTSLRILLHWIATIIITSEMKIKIKTDV